MHAKHLRIPNDTLLLSALNQRVQQAGFAKDWNYYSILWTKFIVYASLTGFFYASLFYIENPLLYVLAYSAYGLSLLFFAFNFSHDFSHDTLFKSKRVNLIGFKLLYTWVGAHPASWKERHINSHHFAPNVEEYDTDLQITSLIRVAPGGKWKWYHRFQHLYAPIAYMTYSLYWIFIKDVIVLGQAEKGQKRDIAYFIEFLFQKAIYITVILVLPLMFSPLSYGWIWIAFFVMHALQSLILLFTFFMTHHVEETSYPETDEAGIIQSSWLMNQIQSSNDMHPFSKLANFILGGFNNHIAHHLYPHIHHIHYPKLSRILYDALIEEGIYPNQTSYWGGIVSHLRYLKRMGKQGEKHVFIAKKNNTMKIKNQNKVYLYQSIKTGLCIIGMLAQVNLASGREVYAVFNLDVTGTTLLLPNQMGHVLRMHFEKLDSFEVIDRYEMSSLHESMGATKVANCYSKSCLAELGQNLKADKVISGSIDKVGSFYLVTLRRLDVKKGEIDKLILREFLENSQEISTILLLAMNELLEIENPEAVYISLTKKDAFDNSINNPQYPRLRADGPRLGVSVVTGEAAKILGREEKHGGFNSYPMTFHFGYQFEKQYLNSGNFQALFEFIPLISGMEQGRLAFSFTMLNGIRSNRRGWEFAFGPSIAFTKLAKVAQDTDGNWLTQELWEEKYHGVEPANGYRKQLDSRGSLALDPSFVLAAGKTLKSGSMNIPLNVFIIPKKDDFRFGVSMGYNAKRQ